MGLTGHVLVVSALVRNEEGEVLLVRHPMRGWELPGGQVEDAEDLFDAVAREVEEETGIRVRVGRLTGVYRKLGSPSGLLLAFLAEATGGELRTRPGESDEVGWFAADDILGMIAQPKVWDRARDQLRFDGNPVYRAIRETVLGDGFAYEVVREEKL